MKFHHLPVYTFLLTLMVSGFAHAAVLVTSDDSYGIPSNKVLEADPGVLENDTLDGENALDGGVTATLVLGAGPNKGDLTCPNVGPGLCSNGSFIYTPNASFDGQDTFQYQALAPTGETSTATVTLSACSGGPTVFTCWHESSYLAKLTTLPSYNLFLESFEGTAWVNVRSPDLGAAVTAPSILSKGITWTTNFPLTNEISTVSGAARTGPWGVFDPNHGLAAATDPTGTVCDRDNPAIECRPHDGLSGSGTALHGVGGYFSGSTGANIAVLLDGGAEIPIGSLLDTGYHFIGVIDTGTSGFTGFEFRELDGKVGQELWIFGDDFIFATTDTVPVNNPPVLATIGNQSVNENFLLSIELTASEMDDGDILSFSMSGEPVGANLYNNFDGTATFSWRPNFGQAGSYPLIFTVTDNGVPVAGSDSEAVTITVTSIITDNTPPLVQITSPANGTALTSASVTVSGTASDNTALTSVTVNGVVATLGGGNFNASVALVAGANTLTAIATDSSGNTASSSVQVTYTPPSVGSLQFSGPAYAVAEDGTSATITVTRVGGSFGIVSVDYSSIAGGSAAVGSDYIAANGSLSFADGVVSQSFSVDIVDDAEYEGDETVNLLLSNVSGTSLSMPSSAVLTITENEPVPPSGSLQFSAPVYSASENGVTATITVTRIGGSFGIVGVDYASADGSAMAGSDYTAVIGSLSFADGVINKTFSVDIFDDADYEGDETLTLTLSAPTGGAGLGSPALAILTISEDDPVPPSGSLQFSAPIYSENENGVSAIITVTRVGGSFGTVGVDYASADASAMAGSDYTAVFGSLSFAGGILSQTFSIDIIDDADYEGDETLSLSLSNPTGGAGLGSPALAMLTISEDDPVPPSGSLQYSAASYGVAEDGMTATITVTRVGGSFGTVGVDYASADGSAMAGSDYTAVIGNLTFADGVLGQSFSVAITDDADYEGDETLSLSLSNPTGGAGLGGPALAILTISEDDPVPPSGSLQFSAPNYSVDENGAMVSITVTRIGGSFGTVGVDYATSDGTATAGSDYTATSGTLSLADGVLSESFNVNILDDSTYEGDESLNLTLSKTTGGAGLSAPDTVSLVIIENEKKVDDVTPVDNTASAGGGGGSIDLMTLFLLFSLYCRNLRINRYGLYRLTR